MSSMTTTEIKSALKKLDIHELQELRAAAATEESNQRNKRRKEKQAKKKKAVEEISDNAGAVAADFYDGLEFVMGAISDNWNPGMAAVTVITDGKGDADLYATNNSTVRAAKVKLGIHQIRKDQWLVKRFEMPKHFCRQLLHLRGRLDEQGDYIVFASTEGNAVICTGKFENDDKSPDFVSVLNRCSVKQFYDIPEDLLVALGHMVPVAERCHHHSMNLNISRDKIAFTAQSTGRKRQQPELTIKYELPNLGGHPSVEVYTEPLLFSALGHGDYGKKGMERAKQDIALGNRYFDQWCVTEKAVALRTGNRTLLIGTTEVYESDESKCRAPR